MRGKTQAMLREAVNSQGSLVIVVANNHAFAMELQRRAMAMLEAGEGSRPEDSEMRFTALDEDRLRGLDADVFVDHNARETFYTHPPEERTL